MRALSVLGLISISHLVAASAGDRDFVFENCVSTIEKQLCKVPISRPLPSILTAWHCTDECKYECMHAITSIRESKGEQIYQYYGKWPFWRIAAMQEPASVLFSVMNLLVHWHGARLLKRRIRDTHPMAHYYTMWSYISMNAWIWSSIFHTRDLPLTEKLDYFSAAATILYALYAVVVRFLHLYPLPQARSTSPPAISKTAHGRWYMIWTTICALVFVGHVTYLTSLPRFDYSYNMAFGVGLGITHNIFWTLYALPSRWSMLYRFPFKTKAYRPSYATKAGIFVALTMAATGFELVDFPPWWRTIDAHTLWHLSTVPLSLLWYDFLVEDAMDEGWRDNTNPR